MTVVTFRKDLAGAVKLRLRKWGVLDEDDDLRYWTTMHAAANRATGLLERDPFEDTSGRLGPAVDVREKACYCKDRGIPFWPPKTREWETTRGQLLFALFDYLATNLIDPHDEQAVRQAPGYDELREQWPSIDVAAEWDRYEEFKDQRDWYDFHELLTAALDGGLPSTRVVVVDEYHDATPLMSAVAERWFKHADISIAAGDPLQVVNEYAGASPSFFTTRPPTGNLARQDVPRRGGTLAVRHS
jgi:DNA helicase-2/ATP-dependent DNA helicase PcrA